MTLSTTRYDILNSADKASDTLTNLCRLLCAKRSAEERLFTEGPCVMNVKDPEFTVILTGHIRLQLEKS